MVMRTSVQYSASLLALAALALCAASRLQAQSTATPVAGNGTYIASDPLANVRYDNRFDVSLGMAYDHMKAGPNLLQGSNLGGLDLSASYWFSRHWAAEGSGRAYLGTSGAAPNTESINGPFVREYLFTAALSFVINYGLFHLCVDGFGLGKIWSMAIAVPPSTLVVFLLLNYRVFRAKPG